MFVTLTYGDPDPIVCEDIAIQLIDALPDSATIYCDRFEGIGQWTTATGQTYTEYSGVIVAAVPIQDLPTLRRNARKVARDNGQDAIGFMIAQGEGLVYA